MEMAEKDKVEMKSPAESDDDDNMSVQDSDEDDNYRVRWFITSEVPFNSKIVVISKGEDDSRDTDTVQ